MIPLHILQYDSCHLTIESPVCYRSHSDATLEQSGVGEEQQGGEKPSIRLGVKGNSALKVHWLKEGSNVCGYLFIRY